MSQWYPNGTGVTIETMDGPLDLADVSWQTLDPTGFIVGIGYAALPGDEMFATPDQFGVECHGRREWERLKSQGWTIRAREHHASCAEYAKVQGLSP